MSFRSLLNKTCKIYKLTETQGSTTGEKEKTWAVLYSGVKCRLDQNTGKEIASPNSILSKADHILFLEKRYTLDSKEYRIKIGNNNYNILAVEDGGGHGHHLELPLQKIG